ncbi:MAG: DUF2157 domain-containing protein [Elusimicrobiota bacterium]|nr:DUF2157 domain-containing protein [Elusimicrobiota bacterium]
MSKYIEKSIKEGIITAEQADKIYKMMDKEKSIKPSGFLMIFFSIIAVCASAAVFYLCLFDNQILPYGVKIGGLICLTFLSAFLGYYLKFNSKRGKAGSALLFLSVLFFGALIFVTAATYALNPSREFHFLLLLWIIAVFPYMYIFKSKAVAALISLLIAAWFSLFVTAGGSWIAVDFPIFPFAYYMLGIFLLCFGRINEFGGTFSDIAAVFQKTGFIFIAVSAFFLTFSFFANAPRRSIFDIVSIYGFSIKLSYIALTIFVLMFLFSVFASVSKPSAAVENILTAVLIAFAAFLSVNEIIPLIVVDALFVFIAASLAASGFRKKEMFYINLGMSGFLFFLVSKYFILCKNILPLPLYYAGGAAAAVLAAIIFENRRRSFKRFLIKSAEYMKAEEQEIQEVQESQESQESQNIQEMQEIKEEVKEDTKTEFLP